MLFVVLLYYVLYVSSLWIRLSEVEYLEYLVGVIEGDLFIGFVVVVGKFVWYCEGDIVGFLI